MKTNMEILNLLPGETVLHKAKGDCWGSFGIRHSQNAGTFTLTDQRILFRGGGLSDRLRLVFAIPYGDITQVDKFSVSGFIPTGIKVVSRQDGLFRLSLMKRNQVMELIETQRKHAAD